MRAGELGDRVVAVADQHALVELLRTLHRHHVVRRRRVAHDAGEPRLGIVDELVQEHAAQALLGP